MKKSKDKIRARLTVYGLNGLRGKELRAFRKWIRQVSDEMERENPMVFAKNFRATLYI